MGDKRKIKLIVAMDENCIIGDKNELPWKGNSEYQWDMDNFKMETINKSIIMGYNTFLSLNSKCLKNRINYLISSKHTPEGIRTFKSLYDFMNYWKIREDSNDLYVIGGAQIYKTFLENDLIDEIVMTIFNESFEGNTKFPMDFIPGRFECSSTVSQYNHDGSVSGRILTYTRKRN